MIRGLIFDLNGTVIDILTDEGDVTAYRTVSNFLLYHGIYIAPEELREFYFSSNRKQRRDSAEEYPEFDVVKIFRRLLRHYPPASGALSGNERHKLALVLSELFRAATLLQLRLYPGVKEILSALQTKYRLAAVSDGQSCWARAEAAAAGLGEYFDPLIVSGDLGFRKPDRRMFEAALREMKLSAGEVLFIGNDMFRDVWGAKKLGIRTVFFRSNQGDQQYPDTEPDYIIYRFSELPEAIEFLSRRMEK